MSKILVNKARCRHCNTIVESVSRHHLAFCPCGKMFVDGGREYLRRGGDVYMIEELSEIQESKPTSDTKDTLL